MENWLGLIINLTLSKAGPRTHIYCCLLTTIEEIPSTLQQKKAKPLPRPLIIHPSSPNLNLKKPINNHEHLPRFSQEDKPILSRANIELVRMPTQPFGFEGQWILRILHQSLGYVAFTSLQRSLIPVDSTRPLRTC
jgi:hypothetical protein